MAYLIVAANISILVAVAELPTPLHAIYCSSTFSVVLQA